MASITRDQLIVDMSVLMENGHTPRVANATKDDYDKGWTKATMAAAHALNVDLSSYATYNNVLGGIFNVIDDVNRYVTDKRNGVVTKFMPDVRRLHPVKGQNVVQEVMLPGINAPALPHVGGKVAQMVQPTPAIAQVQQAPAQPVQRPTYPQHNHAPGPVIYTLQVVDRLDNLMYHQVVESPIRVRSGETIEVENDNGFSEKLLVVWADGDRLKVRHSRTTVMKPVKQNHNQNNQGFSQPARREPEPQPMGHPEFQKLAKFANK